MRFGDCDPAGIVYTPRFAEFVVSAMELFIGGLFGQTLRAVSKELGFGTPVKALSFVFTSALAPDDEFDLVVTVADIRRSSFDLAMTATTTAGRLAFEATISPICVPWRGERRSIAIPPPLRERLEAYREEVSGRTQGCGNRVP